MSNEPASQRDLQALRELVLSNRQSDKEAIALALTSAEKAVDRANSANDKRLELLNEFRVQSLDRDAQYMRSDVYGQQHAALTSKVDLLTDRVATLEGRVLGFMTVGTVLVLASALYELLK